MCWHDAEMADLSKFSRNIPGFFCTFIKILAISRPGIHAYSLIPGCCGNPAYRQNVFTIGALVTRRAPTIVSPIVSKSMCLGTRKSVNQYERRNHISPSSLVLGFKMHAVTGAHRKSYGATPQ